MDTRTLLSSLILLLFHVSGTSSQQINSSNTSPLKQNESAWLDSIFSVFKPVNLSIFKTVDSYYVGESARTYREIEGAVKTHCFVDRSDKSVVVGFWCPTRTWAFTGRYDYMSVTCASGLKWNNHTTYDTKMEKIEYKCKNGQWEHQKTKSLYKKVIDSCACSNTIQSNENTENIRHLCNNSVGTKRGINCELQIRCKKGSFVKGTGASEGWFTCSHLNNAWYNAAAKKAIETKDIFCQRPQPRGCLVFQRNPIIRLSVGHIFGFVPHGQEISAQCAGGLVWNPQIVRNTAPIHKHKCDNGQLKPAQNGSLPIYSITFKACIPLKDVPILDSLVTVKPSLTNGSKPG